MKKKVARIIAIILIIIAIILITGSFWLLVVKPGIELIIAIPGGVRPVQVLIFLGKLVAWILVDGIALLLCVVGQYFL